MKTAIARRLHEVLSCPIYGETVQRGLENPSCVILPPECEVLSICADQALVKAVYQIALRGLEDELGAVFFALSAVTDGDGKVYRGEAISTTDTDGVTVVTVTYRYRAVLVCDEETPLMMHMEQKYGERR